MLSPIRFKRLMVELGNLTLKSIIARSDEERKTALEGMEKIYIIFAKEQEELDIRRKEGRSVADKYR